jgi:hypothetical protein
MFFDRFVHGERTFQRDAVRIVSTRIPKVCGLLVVIVAALIVACGRRYPLGRLAARVVDANNHPVGGVAADLYKLTPAGHVYWRAARTSANGIAIFGGKDGVIEGEYIVHVTLMPWHMFAPGEKNDRTVRVKAGDDTVLSFRVVPRLPGYSAPAPDSSRTRPLRPTNSHA